MKNKITMPLLLALTAMGCGKKNEAPVTEIVQAPAHQATEVTKPPVTPQELTLERAYNLIDNTTPSQLVCEDLLRNFIDQSSARSKAVRGQSERIRQLCGQAPAFQGDTAVVIGCREVSGGDYVPQAIATTKYRCN